MEEDGFLLAGFLAPLGLVDSRQNGVAGLGGGEDALHPGKILRRLKHVGLPDADRLHEPVGVELAENGAHAVEAQAAGVVGAGDIILKSIVDTT